MSEYRCRLREREAEGRGGVILSSSSSSGGGTVGQ